MAELKFALETLTDGLINEMSVLLPDHYEEVAWTDLYKKLNPDWNFYKNAQSAGILKIFTARTYDDNLIVGYWWFFVRLNPHYMDVVQAADDILYARKDYRGKPVFEFTQWCLAQLKKMGVQVVVVHCKVAHDLEKLYSGLGFKPYEKNYIRSL